LLLEICEISAFSILKEGRPSPTSNKKKAYLWILRVIHFLDFTSKYARMLQQKKKMYQNVYEKRREEMLHNYLRFFSFLLI